MALCKGVWSVDGDSKPFDWLRSAGRTSKSALSKRSVRFVNGVSRVFEFLLWTGYSLRSTNARGVDMLGLVAKDVGR